MNDPYLYGQTTVDAYGDYLLSTGNGSVDVSGEAFGYSGAPTSDGQESADLAAEAAVPVNTTPILTVDDIDTMRANACGPSRKNPSVFRYDYEAHPFQYRDSMARHTLGDYDSRDSSLTSYGDFSYYTSGTAVALGYRWEDVPWGRTVVFRNLETNTKGPEARRTDFMPQICWRDSSGNFVDNRGRIADLGKDLFTATGAPQSQGVFYGRTWMRIDHLYR